MSTVSTIAFVGGGHMATSLVGGLVARGTPPGSIVVAEPVAAQRDRLQREFGVRVVGHGAEAAAAADTVVLAVKPQQMAEVSLALAPVIAGRRPTVVSIAAGIRVADLTGWLGAGTAIVRTMPNRPALIGAGVTALYADTTVPAAARNAAEAVMTACGQTVWVRAEDELDPVTAVSGSGPAYFFLLMEAMEAAAIGQGLDPATARRLVVATSLGAARMASECADPPAALREQVTSRGGTTATALAVLEGEGLRDMVARAIAAATRRSAELAREFGTGRG